MYESASAQDQCIILFITRMITRFVFGNKIIILNTTIAILRSSHTNKGPDNSVARETHLSWFYDWLQNHHKFDQANNHILSVILQFNPFVLFPLLIWLVTGRFNHSLFSFIHIHIHTTTSWTTLFNWMLCTVLLRYHSSTFVCNRESSDATTCKHATYQAETLLMMMPSHLVNF